VPKKTKKKKKLHQDSISPQSGWPSSRKQTANASEDSREKTVSYTVGGNANWYNHYQYGIFSKTQNRPSS
jgi:hypothetical protein